MMRQLLQHLAISVAEMPYSSAISLALQACSGGASPGVSGDQP
jgi:hypothetical protein